MYIRRSICEEYFVVVLFTNVMYSLSILTMGWFNTGRPKMSKWKCKRETNKWYNTQPDTGSCIKQLCMH